MVTRKMSRIVLYMTLVAATSANLSGGMVFASGEDNDLVGRIEKALPPGWSVDISTFQGKCYLNVITAPMDTKASMYGNSSPFEQRMKLGISVTILPRYTTKTLERIKSFNKPVLEKLKALGGHQYSDEQRDLQLKLIDEPMFYDPTYGFSVRYASRVPSKAEDSRKLMEVLAAISSDWKSYDTSKPDVTAELRRILTR